MLPIAFDHVANKQYDNDEDDNNLQLLQVIFDLNSEFFLFRLVPLVRNGEVDNEPAKYLNRWLCLIFL